MKNLKSEIQKALNASNDTFLELARNILLADFSFVGVTEDDSNVRKVITDGDDITTMALSNTENALEKAKAFLNDTAEIDELLELIQLFNKRLDDVLCELYDIDDTKVDEYQASLYASFNRMMSDRTDNAYN